MEKLDLSLLSKDTTKKFKNALKLVSKDKDTPHTAILGVGFCKDAETNAQYIIGSNGKIAITYKVNDMPSEFENKVINKDGVVIADNYPNISFPDMEELTEAIAINIDDITELYNKFTDVIKEKKYTHKKLLKDKNYITIPLNEDVAIDYFFFKDFLKILDLVGVDTILYSKDNPNVCVCFTKDCAITGFALNQGYCTPYSNIDINIE